MIPKTQSLFSRSLSKPGCQWTVSLEWSWVGHPYKTSLAPRLSLTLSLSVCVCVFVNLSLCFCFCLSVCLSIHLSPSFPSLPPSPFLPISLSPTRWRGQPLSSVITCPGLVLITWPYTPRVHDPRSLTSLLKSFLYGERLCVFLTRRYFGELSVVRDFSSSLGGKSGLR